MGQNLIPVKEGEELDVKIEALGKKGDGIAKVEGYTIFIPKTKVDDNVKVKITKAMPNFAFAEIAGTQENTTEEEKNTPEDTEDFGEEEKEK